MIEARRRRIGERTHQQRIELLRAGTQGERQIALPGKAPEAVEALGHALDRRGENPPDAVGADGTYAESEGGERSEPLGRHPDEYEIVEPRPVPDPEVPSPHSPHPIPTGPTGSRTLPTTPPPDPG